MEQKVVSALERGIEKAVAEVIMKMGLKRLPLLPSQRTMHLMAKAAVSVYEAAVEVEARGEGE
jgi:tRNA(Leu) C34 or U34 (ribose-2'-O)-methylase TrmL